MEPKKALHTSRRPTHPASEQAHTFLLAQKKRQIELDKANKEAKKKDEASRIKVREKEKVRQQEQERERKQREDEMLAARRAEEERLKRLRAERGDNAAKRVSEAQDKDDWIKYAREGLPEKQLNAMSKF